MNVNLTIILLLICSQAFLLFLHIAVVRTIVSKRLSFSPQLVAIKCALFGNIPLLLISWLFIVRWNTNACGTINVILYVLIVYNALAYTYCHIFNMGDTGRRIKILYELTFSGPLRYEDLDNRYGVKNILEVRLERLIAMKQVTEQQGRFILRSFLLYRIGALILKWGYFLRYNVYLKENLKK